MKDDRYWLSAQSLTGYLKGELLSIKDLIHEDQLFAREGRLGIGIDSSVKHVVEGLLYQVEYVRPQEDVGLLVEVTGIEASEGKWGKQGLLSLGGEMRAARYEVLNKPVAWPQNVQGEQRFKLYLATPACFTAGWRASQWDSLVAAALGRAQPIGGWDVALNRQKVMRRYVPAGSVYYFAGMAPPTGEPVGDDEIDRHIGFGQYFIGRW